MFLNLAETIQKQRRESVTYHLPSVTDGNSVRNTPVATVDVDSARRKIM